MKCLLSALALLLLGAAGAYGVKITPFSDTYTFIGRAKDILIAKCLSVPKSGTAFEPDGLYPVEVEVLMVLKGGKSIGQLRVVTVYPMQEGASYLLTSLG